MLDPETTCNHQILYKRLKRTESVEFGLQQVSLRSRGVLVGGLGDVLVVLESVWGLRSHQGW